MSGTLAVQWRPMLSLDEQVEACSQHRLLPLDLTFRVPCYRYSIQETVQAAARARNKFKLWIMAKVKRLFSFAADACSTWIECSSGRRCRARP